MPSWKPLHLSNMFECNSNSALHACLLCGVCFPTRHSATTCPWPDLFELMSKWIPDPGKLPRVLWGDIQKHERCILLFTCCLYQIWWPGNGGLVSVMLNPILLPLIMHTSVCTCMFFMGKKSRQAYPILPVATYRYLYDMVEVDTWCSCKVQAVLSGSLLPMSATVYLPRLTLASLVIHCHARFTTYGITWSYSDPIV